MQALKERIAGFDRQAEENKARSDAAIASVQQDLDNANERLATAQRDGAASLTALREELLDSQQKLIEANNRALQAVGQREAMAAKFDALFGAEEEPGIRRCPGYLSDDGEHHANLGGARRHLAAGEAAAVTQALRSGQSVPHHQAASLAARLHKVAEAPQKPA